MMRCCVQAAAERPAELSSSTYKNDMDIHTYIHTHTLHRHNILQCTVEPESERQSLRIIVLRSCSNVANRQFNNGLRSGLYYRQWWRQGSPRDGVIVPRQGGWGNARSTLPCKLPPPILRRTTYTVRSRHNQLTSCMHISRNWRRGVVHMRRCIVRPGICVRGRPLPFPYPSPHFAPSFPILPSPYK